MTGKLRKDVAFWISEYGYLLFILFSSQSDNVRLEMKFIVPADVFAFERVESKRWAERIEEHK